mgnify:CR=1 FL=1
MIEAMKQGLSALEKCWTTEMVVSDVLPAIHALRNAIAEAEKNQSVKKCKHCSKYFANYSCGKNINGECDCPKCQGFCQCKE